MASCSRSQPETGPTPTAGAGKLCEVISGGCSRGGGRHCWRLAEELWAQTWCSPTQQGTVQLKYQEHVAYKLLVLKGPYEDGTEASDL